MHEKPIFMSIEDVHFLFASYDINIFTKWTYWELAFDLGHQRHRWKTVSDKFQTLVPLYRSYIFCRELGFSYYAVLCFFFFLAAIYFDVDFLPAKQRRSWLGLCLLHETTETLPKLRQLSIELVPILQRCINVISLSLPDWVVRILCTFLTFFSVRQSFIEEQLDLLSIEFNKK